MSPESKHRPSVNGHKPLKNSQNQGAANVRSVSNSPNLATVNNGAFLQQSSQPQADGSTSHDTSTSTQLQPSTHRTFQFLPRPWTQGAVNSNTSASVNGATPMERWHDERVYDQPWHAIEGVYLHDGEDLDMVQQDNEVDNERRDTFEDNVGSMTCHTSGF
jgi:hypothetical protein